ncbi:anti-sigma factor [Streptomyces sp. ALI-76-A]|uniref:anti-sigma factor n=1 Tax=Streptomyces sp. ALI-76-A TaxID=3025736 RepID=UPI00256F28BD|nr:anti-sigma factor [Streptomyces sp. ALI-76-A]MDL5206496.1 anti-sigma factor [Streptomyces sp. ALI-76-A]
MKTIDLHTLTGAYALHALTAAEASSFERHLATCEACAQEVQELKETAARLGLAAAVTARPELKEHVMRRISTVRQVGPRLAPVSSPSSRSRARRVPRWALAACLAAATALGGGTTIWQHERAQDATEQARRTEQRAGSLATVLAAPDAKTRTTRFADGATATVIVSRSLNQAAFVTAGLAEPPAGKVYELWFDDGGAMRPAGFVNPTRAATAVLMRGGIGSASGMGLTLEPTGGSPQPTSSPLVLMPFPA